LLSLTKHCRKAFDEIKALQQALDGELDAANKIRLLKELIAMQRTLLSTCQKLAPLEVADDSELNRVESFPQSVTRRRTTFDMTKGAICIHRALSQNGVSISIQRR